LKNWSNNRCHGIRLTFKCAPVIQMAEHILRNRM
jgi:hypothetical protein